MKIAQHFRAFLERHNYLQLPQIGKFEVVGENPAAEKMVILNGSIFLLIIIKQPILNWWLLFPKT
jgi:hypothetical protein